MQNGDSCQEGLLYSDLTVYLANLLLSDKKRRGKDDDVTVLWGSVFLYFSPNIVFFPVFIGYFCTHVPSEYFQSVITVKNEPVIFFSTFFFDKQKGILSATFFAKDSDKKKASVNSSR